MSLLEELQEKLSGAEVRVAGVLKELQDFSELKNSLDAADRSLIQSSERLGSMALSMEKNANAMTDTIRALKDTIDIIRRTDPAAVVKAQEVLATKVDQGVKDTEAALTAFEGRVVTKIDDELGSIYRSLTTHGGSLEGYQRSNAAAAGESKRRQNIAIVLLAANVLVTLYLALI